MTLVRLHTQPLINRLKIVFASSAATNLVKAFELLKRFFFFFHRNYPRTVFLLRAFEFRLRDFMSSRAPASSLHIMQ